MVAPRRTLPPGTESRSTQLADTVVVLDHGRVIARGAPDELKTRAGGQVLEVRPAGPDGLEATARVLAELAGGSPAVDPDTRLASVPVDDPGLLTEVVRRLDRAGVRVADLALRRPSLDDVFLRLTGHRTQTEDEDETETEDEKEPTA